MLRSRGSTEFVKTLDSLARLAGHLQPAGAQVNNVAVQTNVNVDLAQIAQKLPSLKSHERGDNLPEISPARETPGRFLTY